VEDIETCWKNDLIDNEPFSHGVLFRVRKDNSQQDSESQNTKDRGDYSEYVHFLKRFHDANYTCALLKSFGRSSKQILGQTFRSKRDVGITHQPISGNRTCGSASMGIGNTPTQREVERDLECKKKTPLPDEIARADEYGNRVAPRNRKVAQAKRQDSLE